MATSTGETGERCVDRADNDAGTLGVAQRAGIAIMRKHANAERGEFAGDRPANEAEADDRGKSRAGSDRHWRSGWGANR
jgi:hypothetical protein